MQERLIDSISQITRINNNGLESLWRDIDALTLENQPEVKDLFKVKKYIEFLKFEGNDEELFAKISEDKIFKFRFSEIERLISQREQIAANAKKAETPDEAQEEETASSFSSYFGLNAIQYYTSNTETYKESEIYKMLHRFFIELYVVGNN